MRLRLMVRSALFVAVTAVCALIAIPNPLVAVPFTLQVLAVCLTGLVLPPRWAFAVQAVYLGLGAVGVPVFAGGTSGPGILVSISGGFLWSYPFAAALAAVIAGQRGGLGRLVAAGVAAIAVIYAFGFAGMVVFGHLPADLKSLAGLGLFVPWDVLKAVLAALIALRLRRAMGAGALAGAA